MPQQMTTDRLAESRGLPIYDSQDEQIGTVEEFYYDQETRKPEWISIGTGFLKMSHAVVPVQGADFQDDRVVVPYPKDQVKGSPNVDRDEIDPDQELELYGYYGINASTRKSDTVLPEGGQKGRSPKLQDDRAEVTRSEEELKVGKRQVEAGQARLRKWVETEPVEVDVELKQETARVTRERIDQPVDDAQIGEEQVDVRLRGEEAVVQKQTVAKERVGVEKDVEKKREKVTDEVRKERVEVEGDARDKRKR